MTAVVSCVWLDDVTDAFGWATGTSESTTARGVLNRAKMGACGALVDIQSRYLIWTGMQTYFEYTAG